MVENSSERAIVSSGIEGLEEEEGGGRGGVWRALETSKAEALHDLDRNSIGILGLSGKRVPLLGMNSLFL